LADFEKNMDEFRKMGITVIAASANSLDETRKFAEELNLSFPIGYGLNPKEISGKTGAFYDEEGGYIHATGFVVTPEEKVVNAVYSTMAIGRLVPMDCMGLIQHLRQG
jgi:peroxiredoxin